MSWTELRQSHFTSTLAMDVASMVLGAHLGDGQFRSVFEWLPRRGVVAKLENGAASFHNVTEHAVWSEVKGSPLAKWFAPVVEISACGIILLQARTKPLKESERKLFPKRVPAIFHDIKPTNWGWYQGRVVCHDYGYNGILHNGLTCGMRRADW